MSLWQSGDYCISTDKTRLDIDVIHRFLVDAYWSKDRPRAVVQRSIDHAVCCIMGHTELQELKRWLLVTADAHGLYEQYGFTRLSSPESLMERLEKQSIRAPRR